MLEVSGVNSFYGRAQVLFDLSLTAAPGEAVALLGRNGAGKTTTLRSILGLLRPHSGSVRFEGRVLTGLPVHAAIRAGLGYVPEDRRMFADLTVAENLEVGRRPASPGLEPWTLARVQALFPKLADLMSRPAGQLSGGEQQMVAIARTLMGNPRLLLLDEPSEGLAPIIVDQMAQALAEVKGQGVGILLSEQNPGFAQRLSDRAYILEKGRIRHEGAMAALAADARARAAWLGV